MKRIYSFNKETGASTVEIISGDLGFVGMACCHDDDMDFMSERTGLQIAEARAELDFLRHIRDNELKPAIKVLQHLQDNMKTSKKYNPESYEASMLRRQLAIKKNELAAIKAEIKTLTSFIGGYIAEKDKLYNKLRQGKNN